MAGEDLAASVAAANWRRGNVTRDQARAGYGEDADGTYQRTSAAHARPRWRKPEHCMPAGDAAVSSRRLRRTGEDKGVERSRRRLSPSSGTALYSINRKRLIIRLSVPGYSHIAATLIRPEASGRT